MEATSNQKIVKQKQASASTVPIRVKRETRRRVQAELAKINKKEFGRKVRVDSLIMRAMGLLTELDTKALQEASLSNADRLEQKYREFQKANPGASKDDFLGVILSAK